MNTANSSIESAVRTVLANIMMVILSALAWLVGWTL
jgi:uncharacterized membrane protein